MFQKDTPFTFAMHKLITNCKLQKKIIFIKILLVTNYVYPIEF